MSRFLLALCLSLCAVAAFAKAPAGNEDCPGAATKAEKTGVANAAVNSAPDGDSATTSHAATVPLHSSSAPRMTSPRWHSLLPGMIR